MAHSKKHNDLAPFKGGFFVPCIFADGTRFGRRFSALSLGAFSNALITPLQSSG
jgi:hypothetical protein